MLPFASDFPKTRTQNLCFEHFNDSCFVNVIMSDGQKCFIFFAY